MVHKCKNMKKKVENENEMPKNQEERREFIKRSALLLFGSLLNADVIFGKNIPEGLIPIGLLENSFKIPLTEKHKDLISHNDKPIILETPPHLLDDFLTPADRFFVRNNGLVPTNIDAKNWKITIDGESVIAPKTISLAEIKSKFKHYSYKIVLECAGNARSEFNPPTQGVQWGVGAVGCAEWTGIRVKDLLEWVGVKKDAVYLAYYGADPHLSGSTKKDAISRGVPMRKAWEDESLLVWAMNGQDLPALNGFPLRLMFGGFPASTCGKWIRRLSLRNREHDGVKMDKDSYRVPSEDMQPGDTDISRVKMNIIEELPVRSLITFPKSGAMINLGRALTLRGHAWSGFGAIREVVYSIDYGQTWQICSLEAAPNKYCWQNWHTIVQFRKKGYYEIWIKATDIKGFTQPIVSPAWNPKGYLNNSCHRIAIKVQ